VKLDQLADDPADLSQNRARRRTLCNGLDAVELQIFALKDGLASFI
jgi:hypothetical protein